MSTAPLTLAVARCMNCEVVSTVLAKRFKVLAWWGLFVAGVIAPVMADSESVVVTDVVVDFAQRVDVPARQSGLISRLTVKQNDVVSNGDLLATLDDAALQIRRRAAALRLESSRMAAEDRLSLRYAETALAEAEAELADSEATHATVRGAIAKNQLRRLRLATERGRLEVARANQRIREAEIEQQLQSAELSQIDFQVQQLQCQTPINGVVLTLHRDAGEWVDAGESVVTVASAESLVCHALVDAEQLDPVTCVGLPVAILWVQSIDHLGEPIYGSLRGKVTSADPGRLPGNRYRLHAEIENRRRPPQRGDINRSDRNLAADWQLVPGVEVTMRIDQTEARVTQRPR
ncbi:MAG: HlyD family efflux transporter periplasmic adaptor subunit [Planctomycetota bacterium]